MSSDRLRGIAFLGFSAGVARSAVASAVAVPRAAYAAPDIVARMSRKSLVLASRDRIREIAASCNTDRIALFGSVARGDDTADSDCDFIADLKPQSTLLHLTRMRTKLEDLLGCTVDVVSRRSILPVITSVEEETIPL